MIVSHAVNAVLDQLLLQFSMDGAYLTGLSYTLINLIAPLKSPALVPFLLQLSTKMSLASNLLKDGPTETDQDILFEIIEQCCGYVDTTHVQEFVDCLLKKDSIVLLDLCRVLVTSEGSCITGIMERVRGVGGGIAGCLLMEVYAIRSGSCGVLA
jgi:hypothetical protein